MAEAESIPTMNLLQSGLLNDDGFIDEFLMFTVRLLKCAIEDPGFVNAKDVCLFLTACVRLLIL